MFNGGNTAQFFKWYKSLSSLVEGQPVGEHYHLALQALWETDTALWQQELDLASLKLAVEAGISKKCCGKAMVRFHHEAYITCVEGSQSGLQASTLHGTLSMDREEYRYTKLYG
jgi:hypothetical protein